MSVVNTTGRPSTAVNASTSVDNSTDSAFQQNSAHSRDSKSVDRMKLRTSSLPCHMQVLATKQTPVTTDNAGEGIQETDQVGHSPPGPHPCMRRN